MKKHYVFLKKNDLLSKVGDGKDEFDTYIRNNVDDVIQWTGPEIEDSLNNGGVEEGDPLVVELLDNSNEWVTCDGNRDIIYTQKMIDKSDTFSVDFGNCIIYFKNETNLNNDEREKAGERLSSAFKNILENTQFKGFCLNFFTNGNIGIQNPL